MGWDRGGEEVTCLQVSNFIFSCNDVQNMEVRCWLKLKFHGTALLAEAEIFFHNFYSFSKSVRPKATESKHSTR